MNETSEQLTETDATKAATASTFKIKDLILMISNFSYKYGLIVVYF